MSTNRSKSRARTRNRGSSPYSLRPKKKTTVFEALNLKENDLKEGAAYELDDQSDNSVEKRSLRKSSRKRKSYKNDEFEGEASEDDEDVFDDKLILDKLPKRADELKRLLDKVNYKINLYKKEFLTEQQEIKGNNTQSNNPFIRMDPLVQKSYVDENAIPIYADIRHFNFELLRKKQLEFGQRLFDVIMMDPPWKLSSSQPSRGVAIQYDSLADELIEDIPVPILQTDGFICIWAINAKYRFTCKLIQKWGYQLVDEITWVKKTVNGKIAKGHGFYLQHAKQSCLIGVKGNISSTRFKKGVASDVIFSERRGQSQKPTEVYEYLERLVPGGYYLEIFGRRNNLRGGWVTIGNEI